MNNKFLLAAGVAYIIGYEDIAGIHTFLTQEDLYYLESNGVVRVTWGEEEEHFLTLTQVSYELQNTP